MKEYENNNYKNLVNVSNKKYWLLFYHLSYKIYHYMNINIFFNKWENTNMWYWMNFDPNDDRYIYDIVSRNIKYFRLHNNSKYSYYGKMTQEKLAELCDLSTSLIGNIESRKVAQSFSIAVLYRISRVLEVDIREFFVDRKFNNDSNRW